MSTITFTGTIVGIDIGPERSAYATLSHGRELGERGWVENAILRDLILGFGRGMLVALESPQPQDRPLGKLLRDTIIWAGRFIEALEANGVEYREMDERDVALWLCGSRTSSNPAVRQCLIDRFGDKSQQPCACGTGRVPGARDGTTKKCPECHGERFVTEPSALHGFNAHERSALACAVTLYEKREHQLKAS